MATFEKRVLNGNINYRVKVRHKGYPAQTKTFKRLADAQVWAKSLESKMDQGLQIQTTQSKKNTLALAVDRYLETVMPRKPKSAVFQTHHLERWKQELGRYTLGDVTAPMIAAVRDKLLSEKIKSSKGSQRTPATVNRYVGSLSHLFNIAIKEWGWVHENPISKINKFKESRGRVRFLTETERNALLAACKKSKNKSLYTITVLCLATGARKMEILGLEKQEVSMERQAIVLQDTKNGERRVLHLGEEAWALLNTAVQKSNPASHLVFPSPNNPSRSVDIQSAWYMAVQWAKLKDFRFHDLRHSAASYLAMNGATSAEIAEILGHKSLDMVKRYAHLSDSHTAQVVAAMNKKIFASQNTL